MTPIHLTDIPMGLCLLFESVGFKTLLLGTFDYIKTIFKTYRWHDYRKYLNIFGSVPNEERNVAQTWILAKK